MATKKDTNGSRNSKQPTELEREKELRDAIASLLYDASSEGPKARAALRHQRQGRLHLEAEILTTVNALRDRRKLALQKIRLVQRMRGDRRSGSDGLPTVEEVDRAMVDGFWEGASPDIHNFGFTETDLLNMIRRPGFNKTAAEIMTDQGHPMSDHDVVRILNDAPRK
jgi:hypothetical protein